MVKDNLVYEIEVDILATPYGVYYNMCPKDVENNKY